MWIDKNIYIWGNGNVVRRYLNQIPNDINICAIVDRDKNKWGSTNVIRNGRNLVCIEDNLTEKDFVIIAIEDPHVVDNIAEMLERRHIEWCHIFKVVDETFIRNNKHNNDIREAGLMMKFIDVMLPTAKCNMKCDYCYLSHLNVELDRTCDFYHDARYIRYSLSQKRLGGSAFINLCGVGETLFCENIQEIVSELLNEGHYIQIVTNATPTNIIKSFINSDIDCSRLFFKCSLHYEELKRLNMLERFVKNVNMLDEWGASYSVEYVPMDSSVNIIPVIKEFCITNFGALPHVTVTRDERYKDYRPLTKYSLDEYRRVWGEFESAMFDFKMDYLIGQKNYCCKAGLWSAELNLATGDLFMCTNNPQLGNIYQDIENEITFKEIGSGCCVPYCINAHAYLTFGLMPEYDTPTYLEMRDRVKRDGSHWIKETLRNVFSQKLSLNNNWVSE